MSTTATPAAAAAAPAAGTPPVSKISADIRRRAQGLTALTKEQIDEEKAKADKVAADAKAAEDKRLADEAAAKAAAAPATPVVDKVKKVKAGPPLPEPAAAPGKSVDDQVREALAKDKAAATAAAPVVAPEVERELELARFAAKKHPDRYTGQADKIVGFYQSRDAMLAEKAKELGGQQTGEFKDYIESDEFKEWVRVNRPAYQRGDVARLQEDMMTERVRAETRAEMAPEIRALERKTLELEHAPVIQARTNAALQIIITDPNAEKDPALEGFAKDPMKFGEEHPEEARLIAGEANEGVELIREVYRIDRNLVDFDPKRPTPQQIQINRFMVAQNAALREKHPTGFETQDGKILVDADTFERRGLSADPRYRTFTADEIAGMIAATKNAEVLAKLRQRREGVSKSIYAAKGAPAAAAASGQAATAAAEDPPSPDAVVSRSPSAMGKTSETKMQTMKNRHLNGKG